MKSEGKLYCSLDIETSGFDPLNNEILEVGFVFFTSGKKGIKITEEWTQVFNTKLPVSPQIFALTGITQAEIDKAPKFSQAQKFLQDKLGNAVIVGHNVIFDIKFLETFGIKFSGRVIDTLDLVQFILPTHHSYNLENLMHTFGISHKEAHRALADSKATLKLFEKLLQIYSGFPQELKQQIQKLIATHNLEWQKFLDGDFPPLSFKDFVDDPATEKSLKKAQNSFELKSREVYNFSLDENYLETLTKAAKPGQKLLLVVPKAQTALDLLRLGKVSNAVFLPEWQFDPKRLSGLLKKKNFSLDETKFLLKLLVWQHTNWQTETVLDLNLSFFGGQFKNLVTGKKIKENKSVQVVACDHAAFLYLSEQKLYRDRQVVVCGLSEFEAAITSNIGTKASWGYINYILKSHYNPELNTGQAKFKEAVERALLAGDLFFGLVGALLKTDLDSFQYFRISPEVEYDERYQKVKTAAESYVEKLRVANQVLASKEIEKFVESLKDFFLLQENRVKWIELSKTVCAFLSMPLEIAGLVKDILKPFLAVAFADSLDAKILPNFFLKRLGLKDFIPVQVKQSEAVRLAATKSRQGDLFSVLKKALSGQSGKINYYILAKTPTSKELADMVGMEKSLPAALLFGGTPQVREFYEQYYEQLKKKSSVLAQTGSGGSNKIFRNFSIHPNGLLLATNKFVLKSLNNQSVLEPVKKLSVRTLILCRLPFEQFTHPYQEALSAALPNAFEDYAVPRALYNFHSIIKFFYTPALKQVFIIDAKLSKPYAKVFKDYYLSIPGTDLAAPQFWPK